MFLIAEAFELDLKGIPLGGACLPAKRFGSEHSGAGNALLYDLNPITTIYYLDVCLASSISISFFQ